MTRDLSKYIFNNVCYKIWVCTFFLRSESVAAELFTEIRHTLSRHKPLSAIHSLAIISKHKNSHTGIAAYTIQSKHKDAPSYVTKF